MVATPLSSLVALSHHSVRNHIKTLNHFLKCSVITWSTSLYDACEDVHPIHPTVLLASFILGMITPNPSLAIYRDLDFSYIGEGT